MPLRAWLDQFGLGYQRGTGQPDLSPDEARRLKEEHIAKAEWIKSLDTKRKEVRSA